MGALYVAFALTVLRAMAVGAESCGCFGDLITRTPAEAFWQDLVLLLPPLLSPYLALV